MWPVVPECGLLLLNVGCLVTGICGQLLHVWVVVTFVPCVPCVTVVCVRTEVLQHAVWSGPSGGATEVMAGS